MSPLYWQIIGGFLVLWVIYDLIAGYTYLHKKIERKYEPLQYWSVLAMWSLIAAYSLGLFYLI